MNTSLEEVSFLARSENRVAILCALNERPRNRRDIETATGVSRSTLGRVLGELEEHGWIERNGQTYETTTAGELVLDRFVPLLDTVAGLHTIGDAIKDLPIEDISLDVRHFADAKVIPLTELQPTKAYDYGIDKLRDADRFWCVARSAPPAYVTAIHEEVTSGQFDVTCVLENKYLNSLSDDDEMLAQWRDMASGVATIQRHEGPIPYVLIVLDGIVHLWLCEDHEERHVTIGLLESDDPAVLSWAEDTITGYLNEAQPLRPTPEVGSETG